MFLSVPQILHVLFPLSASLCLFLLWTLIHMFSVTRLIESSMWLTTSSWGFSFLLFSIVCSVHHCFPLTQLLTCLWPPSACSVSTGASAQMLPSCAPLSSYLLSPRAERTRLLLPGKRCCSWYCARIFQFVNHLLTWELSDPGYKEMLWGMLWSCSLPI